MHRAELERREVGAVFSEALLRVEDWALRIDLDEQRDQSEEGEDEERADDRERDVAEDARAQLEQLVGSIKLVTDIDMPAAV